MRSLLLLSLLFAAAFATQGVDFSTALSLSTFQCLKSNGMSFAIPRAYKSYGAFDSNSVNNIINAKSAGIPYVDVYMFPCRGKSASTQVTELMNGLSSVSSKYGQVWIDVETNPSTGCSWTQASGSSNCAYLQELVDAISSHGKVPGIYSSYYMWESIMGGAQACSGFGAVPLWYAHYDNYASFSDFQSFGGWTKPNIKQYKGDTTLCSAGVDMNFY